MLDTAQPQGGIGHNEPPKEHLLDIEGTQANLRAENEEELLRLAKCIAAAKAVPKEINDESTAEHISDLIKSSRKAMAVVESIRKIAKEPYTARGKAVDAVFNKPKKELEALLEPILGAQTLFLQKKKDEERAAASAEAERQREETARLEREAAEAEAKRVEAERKRHEEEAAAQRAQQEREAAQQRAREAEAAAAQAKADEARLLQERKEREAREAEEREKRRIEAQAEEKRRAAYEADEERKSAERAEQRKAEEAKIAELRKDREAAEKSAAEERAKAKVELEKRRQAEVGARDAGQQAREAGKEEKTAFSGAQRAEKAADRHDRKATGSSAGLARTTSDYGTVGTLARRWTYDVKDYDCIPMNAIWPFIAKDAIDVAVGRYMAANKDLLNRGEQPLDGVFFELLEESRNL